MQIKSELDVYILSFEVSCGTNYYLQNSEINSEFEYGLTSAVFHSFIISPTLWHKSGSPVWAIFQQNIVDFEKISHLNKSNFLNLIPFIYAINSNLISNSEFHPKYFFNKNVALNPNTLLFSKLKRLSIWRNILLTHNQKF